MKAASAAASLTVMDATRAAPGGRSVLVAYATCFGSTRGIAERIAANLSARGQRAALRSVEDVVGAGDHDAVVFGSPVFNQRWLPEGDAFIRRNLDALAARPVWLFSVGTFGDGKRLIGPLMKREPKGIADLRDRIGPRDYRVFAGVIERDRWPLASRILFHAFGGRLGDNRDWAAIDAWSDAIAQELSGAVTPRRVASTRDPRA